jgi:FtsZ-binding cell division protein ZapB
MQDAYVVIALIALTAFFKREDGISTVNLYKQEVQKLEDKQDKLAKEFKEIQSALQATKLINSIKTFPGNNNGRG